MKAKFTSFIELQLFVSILVNHANLVTRAFEMKYADVNSLRSDSECAGAVLGND